MIIFTEKDHSYVGGDIQWKSATSLLKYFEEPFNDSVADACSAKKTSKWYGIPPDEIRKAWKDKSERALSMGSWYHKKFENELCSATSCVKYGQNLEVVPSLKLESGLGVMAPDQKLKDNSIYPEHLCYLKSAGVCGQADLVEVVNKVVNIEDHKTSETIDRNSVLLFDKVSKERKPKKMLGPLSHLEHCNSVEYSLQLSIYMYIILKHNFLYKPGKLTINQIIFEESGKDKYGDRIIRCDKEGNPIVKDVVKHSMDYMKSEVKAMFDYYQEIRNK